MKKVKKSILTQNQLFIKILEIGYDSGEFLFKRSK